MDFMDTEKRIEAVRVRVRERWMDMVGMMSLLGSAYLEDSQADAFLRMFHKDVPARDGAAVVILDLAMTCIAIFAQERLDELLNESNRQHAERN